VLVNGEPERLSGATASRNFHHACVACRIPARRAQRTDPLEVLRTT
jgi:ABC-type lipoprotein release transport system permease subunit